MLGNMNKALLKYRYCFLAGLCAAGGSFFGKLPSFLSHLEIPYLNSAEQTHVVFALYQCLPIALMILSNLLNWRYYLKALQMTEQTLIATVLTAASNYMASFVLGAIVFKEPFTIYSILGSTCIVLGLWCLCADNQGNKSKPKKV